MPGLYRMSPISLGRTVGPAVISERLQQGHLADQRQHNVVRKREIYKTSVTATAACSAFRFDTRDGWPMRASSGRLVAVTSYDNDWAETGVGLFEAE